MNSPVSLIEKMEGRLAGVKEQHKLARTLAWRNIMEGKVDAWEEALKLVKEHQQ